MEQWNTPRPRAKSAAGSFFAFKNEEADGAFAVVYRRDDGG